VYRIERDAQHWTLFADGMTAERRGHTQEHGRNGRGDPSAAARRRAEREGSDDREHGLADEPNTPRRLEHHRSHQLGEGSSFGSAKRPPLRPEPGAGEDYERDGARIGPARELAFIGEIGA